MPKSEIQLGYFVPAPPLPPAMSECGVSVPRAWFGLAFCDSYPCHFTVSLELLLTSYLVLPFGVRLSLFAFHINPALSTPSLPF